MQIRATIFIVLLLVTAGCVEKRKPVSSGSAGQPAPSTAPAPKKEEPAAPSVSAADYARNLSSAPNRAAAIIDFASVNRAIANFQGMEGRLPASLDELVAKRYLPQLPVAPVGKKLSYDPSTGKVELVSK